MKNELIDLYEVLGKINVSGAENVKRMAGCFIWIEKKLHEIDQGSLKISYMETGGGNVEAENNG